MSMRRADGPDQTVRYVRTLTVGRPTSSGAVLLQEESKKTKRFRSTQKWISVWLRGVLAFDTEQALCVGDVKGAQQHQKRRAFTKNAPDSV
ncbi:hypothetical protein FB645_001249 [Coemansia sp. IMI 203386]|nr:hypothetical protein FB645_001249 [Coemansia sp. IMI 203386]